MVVSGIPGHVGAGGVLGGAGGVAPTPEFSWTVLPSRAKVPPAFIVELALANKLLAD